MLTQSVALSRLILVRLNPGEDVREGLARACQEQGVRNGVILSGAGSLSRYHVHVVQSTNLPPGNTFMEGEGPYDVVAVTGLVNEGRVHAHITLADAAGALGGHVEDGCRVLTFLIVAIGETPEAQMADWDRKYVL